MSLPPLTSSGTSAPQFQVRQRVYAMLDGAPRRATIIDVKVEDNGSVLFYVRFLDQDSRMDTWLSPTDLRPCEGKSNTRPASVTVNGPTIQTRSMAIRAQSSNAAELPEPPKKHHVHVDPVVMRQRKDSSFFSRPKNVTNVIMGPYDVDAWYFSPYHCARPQVRNNIETCAPCFFSEGASGELELRQDAPLKRSGAGCSSTGVALGLTLHLCPFCLEPFTGHNAVVRHLQSVCRRHPPGNEIYRDIASKLILFEFDGMCEHPFAKNLALLSKLFLEHKALDCDMTPFLFYVLCEVTPLGCQVLGYFSKEKISPDGFNLSCILTLPQYQGRGIGRFLVEVSYELSRREGKCGSPEKPLSDLGEIAYVSYWKDAVMDVLAAVSDKGSGVSIESIVAATCMTQQDVVATLQKLNILSGGTGGKQQAPRARYSLCVTSEHIRQHEERKSRRLANTRNYIFDAAFLSWQPSWYSHLQEAPAKTFEAKLSQQAVHAKKPIAVLRSF